MSADYSVIVLKGHVGGMPTLNKTTSGQSVCNFNVAKNESYTAANGTKVEKVTWYRVSVWNATAEACARYLVTGSGVTVQGNLIADKSGHPRIWAGQDGVARASFEIRADVVKFDDSKEETQARRVQLGVPDPEAIVADEDVIPVDAPTAAEIEAARALIAGVTNEEPPFMA